MSKIRININDLPTYSWYTDDMQRPALSGRATVDVWDGDDQYSVHLAYRDEAILPKTADKGLRAAGCLYWVEAAERVLPGNSVAPVNPALFVLINSPTLARGTANPG